MTSGSLSIADHPTDPIEIDCQKCGRHGHYNKPMLVEKHGSAVVLPDLIGLLSSDCKDRRRLGNQGCGAIYPTLMRVPKYIGS